MASYEKFTIGAPPDSQVDVVRRNHELREQELRPGDIMYNSVGKYAVSLFDQGNVPQDFVPSDELDMTDQTSYEWQWTDVLRTRSGQGDFRIESMDKLDAALFGKVSVATAENRLQVSSEQHLHELLRDYRIPLWSWADTKLPRLFRHIQTPADDRQPVGGFLHDVRGDLWLSRTQITGNVYRTTRSGTTKLLESALTPYDERGNAFPIREQNVENPKKKITLVRSSQVGAGETERAYDALWRSLQFILGQSGAQVDNLEVAQGKVERVISTGSTLRMRQGEAGHHQFPHIYAQDRIYYFDIVVDPATTDPNGWQAHKLYDNGNPRKTIQYSWLPVSYTP